MSGRGEPPEGVPEGAPGGGDDEFRFVVFDESFVRAARIQELSARERMGAAVQPVKPRGTRPLSTLPRQAFVLMLLIAMAFAAAVYMGIRNPQRAPSAAKSRLTVSIVPLVPPAGASAPASSAPASPAPGGGGRGGSSASDGDPFAELQRAVGPAFYDGSIGLVPPAATATAHFSADQVARALAAVQQYLVASALDPKVLVEGGTGGVRELLDPEQRAQFHDSVNNPRDDLHHEATGWLVRFDPAEVTLAVSKVKVAGSMAVSEIDENALEVLTDHTFVYALQEAQRTGSSSRAALSRGASPAPSASASPADQRSVPGEPVTLFTVRRELRFRLDRGDIGDSQLQLVDAVVQAGPMACDAHTEAYLRPLLARRVGAASPSAAASASSPAASSAAMTVAPQSPAPVEPSLGIDPLDRLHHPAWQVCGVLTGPMATLSTGR